MRGDDDISPYPFLGYSARTLLIALLVMVWSLLESSNPLLSLALYVIGPLLGYFAGFFVGGVLAVLMLVFYYD